MKEQSKEELISNLEILLASIRRTRIRLRALSYKNRRTVDSLKTLMLILEEDLR